MKTGWIIGVVIVLALVVGGVAWYMRAGSTATPANVPPEGAITIEGEVVCLPHRDTSGPQTLECAYGLHDSADHYYMLIDETATSGTSAITSIPTGSSVTVEGQFEPGMDDLYATIGTITIDTIIDAEGNTLFPNSGESHSDGTITFERPDDFGLAVTDEQILVKSYIPPCDSGFAYCLYYYGDDYEGTNFESAGIAIRREDSFTTEDTCLATPPDGYIGAEPAATSTGEGYVMSVFSPLGDAGAGHFATGDQYRLFTSDTCYTITARIGETQFANYPQGGIEEFTESDQKTLFQRLRDIIAGFTLNASGNSLMLPQM